jgi:hypothetical protein
MRGHPQDLCVNFLTMLETTPPDPCDLRAHFYYGD